MSLVAMGANYKSSKLDALERISIPAAEIDGAVATLRDLGFDGIAEARDYTIDGLVAAILEESE